MRLLIICQKVDEQDDLLGFFIGWIREFAKKAEKVYVICLGKGEYHLPENVEVFSLGKERGVSRLGRWINFYKELFKIIFKIDVVFSHMCPIYAVAASPVRLLGKKNTMWYAHGSVNLTLKLAIWLSNIVFTSSTKGCRIKSDKVRIVGQGIDTNLFSFSYTDGPRYSFLTVGRISPAKGYETLIEAVEMTVKEYGPDTLVRVIGKEGMPSQKPYFEKLKQLIKDKGLEKNFYFLGSVPNKDMAQHYQKARLFVNMSTTGSLDKTVFEAMACGTPAITCNEAYNEIYKNEKYKDVLGDRFLFKPGDAKDLAKKMVTLITAGQVVPPNILREIVTENHSLDKLIDKIYGEIIRRYPGL